MKLSRFPLVIATTLISITASLVICEIILQVFEPFGFRVKGQKIVLPTNTTMLYVTKDTPKLDHQVVIHKNSLGFRGEEPPQNFRDYLTFITVGGSTTESIMISEGDTWSDILGKNFKRKNESVWINNAGLDGHSSFGHEILIPDYVAPLKPNFIIMLVGANDLALSEGRAYDTDLKKNPRLITMKEWFTDHFELAVLAENIQRYFKTKDAGLTDTQIVDFSALQTQPANTLTDYYIADSIENYPDYVELSQEATQSAVLGINHSNTPEDLYLSDYKKRLKHIIEITRNHSSELILVTQPAVYGFGTDPSTGADLEKMIIRTSNGEWGEGLAGGEKWRLLEQYNDITRQIGKEENIYVVDLAQKMPKDSKYYYDFIHFSKEGSQKVADIIYEDLCANRDNMLSALQQYCEVNDNN